MSNFVIALLLAIGTSAWLYTKFLRKTGNNTKTSIIATAIGGIFIFFAAWFALNVILK
jgi:hypothetical protein